MKLSIVIPVYNEETSIERLLDKISRLKLIDNIEKEILVVNDCSTDSTEEIVKQYISDHKEGLIKYFKHEKNLGKGGSVKTGIMHASGDLLIIQDADLEYDPHDINLIIDKFKDHSVNVVYGSRMLKERSLKRSGFFTGKHPDAYLFAYIGNLVITGLINLIHSENYTDIFTCYKCFKTEFIRSYHIDNNNFNWEPEITIKLSQNNITIQEVPIYYYPRKLKKGKKIKAIDGFRAIACILKYSFFKNNPRFKTFLKTGKLI